MLIPKSEKALWLPTLPDDVFFELTQAAFAWVMRGGSVLMNECFPSKETLDNQRRRTALDEHWHFFKSAKNSSSKWVLIDVDKDAIFFVDGITTHNELMLALRSNQKFADCYSVAIGRNKYGIFLGFTKNNVRPHIPLWFISCREKVAGTITDLKPSLKAAIAFRDSLLSKCAI